MRILFVTPSYKPAYVYGGPAISVSELAEALVSTGHRVTVYTTTANGKEELNVVPGVAQDVNGVSVLYFRRLTGDHTHISPALWARLSGTCKEFDLIHFQSWWSILILGAALICKTRGQHFIVSPRGMLSTYTFLHNNSFYKRAIHKVLGRRLLQYAFLHATTKMEWEDCHLVLANWKGFIAPNLVQLPVSEAGRPVDDTTPLKLGFLSRVDPKKGIELLFYALSKTSFRYSLWVAGSGETTYIESLKSLAAKLGIADRVTWCGWKSGQDKFSFLRSIDLFILPSYNENFANSVIESLAVGCPVLVSNKVGLFDYVEEKRLGWVCEPNHESILERLEHINAARKELNDIKITAPFQIEKDFNKKKLALEYIEAYGRLTTNHSFH